MSWGACCGCVIHDPLVHKGFHRMGFVHMHKITGSSPSAHPRDTNSWSARDLMRR